MGKLDAVTLAFSAGLAFTAVLVVRRVPGALILGIGITTLPAVPVGRWRGDASAITPDKAAVLALTV